MPIYTPAAFAPADPAIAWRIIREHPFGLMLLPGGSITPLPLLGDESSQLLLGHVARANDAARHPDGTQVDVIFLGPHAYVSPTWYANPREQVPTWNYVAATATGTLRWLGPAETRRILDDLCARFEPPGGYSSSWLAPELLEEMVAEVAGFEIRVREVRAKLKLSQNRSPADRERVRSHFSDAPAPGPELAKWMSSSRD